MQTTGIVRKLDELGRITIPQNLKKRLNIDSGDRLEVFLLPDGVAFKKFSSLGENAMARKCCSELKKTINKICFITDKDGILVTGNGGHDDEKSLKNVSIIQDVIKTGNRYNGLDADKTEWITIIPLGVRGCVAGVFMTVHGKKEDISIHKMLEYTAAIIGSNITETELRKGNS
ncbi:MAG: AbrB/MazE/SpoVT family DNA-binding domain-containing protein [Oscillospiraceae bacterium]|nr:AbrB/MazE/SpoVT family DNA-binding domain-containing protein [Oscillospiraceae bacterium]